MGLRGCDEAKFDLHGASDVCGSPRRYKVGREHLVADKTASQPKASHTKRIDVLHCWDHRTHTRLPV